MKILAVDFSSEHRSVAVVEEGRLLGRASAQGGRATVSLVEQALAEAGLQREAVDIVAVGTGPGSYTGIRGSIAFAQGWQLAREIRLLGVSSAEGLAARAVRDNILGKVNIVIDAQRNEFYLSRCEIEPGSFRVVEPLRLAAAAEIEGLLRAGEIVAGPELKPFFAGALDLNPDAAVLGLLAAGRTDFIPGEKLEPIYLRETAFKKAPPLRVLS